MNWRCAFYRWVARLLVKWIAPRAFKSSSRFSQIESSKWSRINWQENENRSRIWFHAASAGELESLWTLIEETYLQTSAELIITIFSDSALKPLTTLCSKLRDPGRVLFSGFSPLEGVWEKYLLDAKPNVFVTAKYEAWPDLWVSLSRIGIPLVIVGARARSSLSAVKKLCRLLGVQLPELIFTTQLEAQNLQLKELFPTADIFLESDPRWDRVKNRVLISNPKVEQMQKVISDLPRPWGILGSAWAEDVRVWSCVDPSLIQGTLWIVPHHVDPQSIAEIRAILEQMGLTIILSTEMTEAKASAPPISLAEDQRVCIVVNEMGFLAELYRLGDWAFVGGGYGAGIHSTIEPAVHGIPIAGGPNGAHKFDEIEDLIQTGQFTLIHDAENLSRWLQNLPTGVAQRFQWQAQTQSRLGSADRILKAVIWPLCKLSAPKEHDSL